jgi:hypothetical protein
MGEPACETLKSQSGLQRYSVPNARISIRDSDYRTAMLPMMQELLSAAMPQLATAVREAVLRDVDERVFRAASFPGRAFFLVGKKVASLRPRATLPPPPLLLPLLLVLVALALVRAAMLLLLLPPVVAQTLELPPPPPPPPPPRVPTPLPARARLLLLQAMVAETPELPPSPPRPTPANRPPSPTPPPHLPRTTPPPTRAPSTSQSHVNMLCRSSACRSPTVPANSTST